MTGFNAAEKFQSQVPALQVLVALGYKPLSQAQAERGRGGRLRNVVLDDVLVDQLLKLNRFSHRGRDYPFDLEDAHEAIRRLKPTPDKVKGLRGTNQEIYDLLVLGTTITKSIDGDSKSYSFRYVDWERPENNVYHVTAEMVVERMASTQTRRLDIVCFVNGIPFVVIENKRPTVGLKKAQSQLIRYQGEDNIPHLFHYAQLLMTMNRKEARYATVGTPAKFWQVWREEGGSDAQLTPLTARGLTETERDTFADALEDTEHDAADIPLSGLINQSMGLAEEQAVFDGEFASAKAYFDALTAEGGRAITDQDRTIYALCRPERLLDLVRRFTVFDGGERKITRHQQYLSVCKAIGRGA